MRLERKKELGISNTKSNGFQRNTEGDGTRRDETLYDTSQSLVFFRQCSDLYQHPTQHSQQSLRHCGTIPIVSYPRLIPTYVSPSLKERILTPGRQNPCIGEHCSAVRAAVKRALQCGIVGGYVLMGPYIHARLRLSYPLVFSVVLISPVASVGFTNRSRSRCLRYQTA